MKKAIALLLAVLMVISMAACAPAEPAGTTAGKADTTTAKDNTTAAADTTEAPVDLSALPMVEPGTVKLTIGLQQNATVLDYEDNYTTKYLEDKTGIDLEFVFFSSDKEEAQQQLALMVANKEKLPDIIFGILDDTLRAELGAEELLVDLTPYFETSWYYAKQKYDVMSDYEKDYMWARLKDPTSGAIYAYPTHAIVEGASDIVAYHACVNKTFASNVGMKAEEIDTVAELYEFLKKAVNEDGNGNGEKDEIGLVYRQDGYDTNAEMWIINAYVYCHDNYFWNATDGVIWDPYSTDEYRQAMIEMNKWYKEGLISPLAYSVREDSEMKALIETPDNYKLAAWGGHPSLVCSGDILIANEYAHSEVLADETGLGGYAALDDMYQLLKNAAITTYCENPELAFRLFDFMCEDTTSHVMRYGEEGVNWEHIDGAALNEVDVMGRPSGMRVIDDEWSKETKQTWHANPVYFGSSGGYESGLSHGGETLVLTEGHRFNLNYGNKWEMEGVGGPDEVVYTLIYNAEEQETVNEVKDLLKDFVLAARAEFVTGVKDPNNDADWQKYLDELEANGLSDWQEVAQAAYTRMQG